MPSEEGGLKGFYYGLSDKAWAFAEWLEGKGLPLATFCDKHHINPLLLLMLIFLAILVLLMLALGAFGGVSYGTLTVEVKSGTMPVAGATVAYEFAGKPVTNTTGPNGKVDIRFPMGPKVLVTASKSGFKSASAEKMTDKEKDTLTISIQRQVGNLRVNVDVEGDIELPGGTYVKIESSEAIPDLPPNTIPGMKNVVGGVAAFNDLPAGAKVSVYLSLSGGDQKIPADPQVVTIQEGKTAETTVTVTENTLSTSVEVNVKDSSYQPLSGINVQLFSCDGDALSTVKQTYSGVATFDNIPLGTSVYVTAASPQGSYSSYNGRDDCITISSPDPSPLEVVLTVVGVATVCVYDEDGNPASTLSGTKSIQLKQVSGQTLDSKAITQECETFTGLPNGARVYPAVSVQGYAIHNDPTEAKTVDYAAAPLRFDVSLSTMQPGQQANIYVHVSDCNTGDPISGIGVRILDSSTGLLLDESHTECGGSATVDIPACGNVAGAVTGGGTVYAVVFDNDYILKMSEKTVAQEGTIIEVCTERVDESNAGSLDVCVYKDGQPFEGADVELYTEDNDLLWTGNTEDDEVDPDNCFTFTNIPDGQVVYAKATNIATNPASSGTVTIIGGETVNATIYAGTPPVILRKGDINVCVRSAATNQSMTANVSVYDQITDQKIVAGPTATGGCRKFSDIVAESNDGGQVSPREIYIVVTKAAYASYNGKNEDGILTMVPNGQVNANVYLKEAYSICVQVRAINTSQPMKDVNVMLYYEDTNTTPVDKKKTPLDGIVRFAQASKDEYFFKLSENYTFYKPLSVYRFSREEVSGSNCGVITLYDLGSLCTLGIEILNVGTNISVIAGQDLKIPFRVMEGSERGDASASVGSTSNKHKIQLNSGDEANVTLKINGQFRPFLLAYGGTEYSSDEELVASAKMAETGTFRGMLELSKNQMCVRQAVFDIEVYKEGLIVTVDPVTFDPATQPSVDFCIYAKDQKGNNVTDASVTVNVDAMDGWAQTASRPATYSEARGCYRGSLAQALVPKEGNNYKAGTLTFIVTAKRGTLTVITDAQATINATKLCGNKKVDSGEKCDGSATTTGCPSGQLCNSDCTACEEKACGALMVSAGSATLNFGSGAGSGICVKVSDSCGTVKDAQVTASFDGSGGWMAASKQTASFDVSKGCYYIPIADNLICPPGSRVQPSQIKGTKTVSVGAVKGDRTGSATATVSVKCGCDHEDWCEAGCACDEDCDAGGMQGSLNLFDCLKIGAQSGQFPQGSSGYTPYGQYGGYQGYGGQPGYGGYRGGYGYGSCGMSQTATGPGSLSISSGGQVTAGGISLDWDKCKEMFGWGDDSAIKGYVKVNDELGVIGGGPDDAGSSCQMLIRELKKNPNFNYVYVNEQCCTKPGSGLFSTKCSLSDFEKLAQSAIGSGNYMEIHIISALRKDLVAEYNIDNIRVFGEEPGKAVLYSTAGTTPGMYASDVIFSATGHLQGGAKALVWGTLGSPRLPNLGSALSSGLWTTREGITSVGYPQGATNKNIVLASVDLRDLPSTTYTIMRGNEITYSGTGGAAPAAVPGAAGTPPQQSSGNKLQGGMFSSISDRTTLYVITDYATYTSSSTSVIKEVAKTFGTGTVPKFEEVRGEDLRRCELKDGPNEFKIHEGGPYVLLRVAPGAYIAGVGGWDLPYSFDSITKEISAGPLPTSPSTKTGLAYGKEKGTTGREYLLVAGENQKLPELAKRFIDERPEQGATRIYTDGENYVVIPANCSKVQKCTGVIDVQPIINGLKTEMAVPENVLPADWERRISLGMCRINPEGERVIKGAVNLRAFSDDLLRARVATPPLLRGDQLKPYVTITVDLKGSEPLDPPLSDSSMRLASCDLETCIFELAGVKPKVGDSVWANIDFSAGLVSFCGSSDEVVLTADQIGAPIINVGALTLNKGPCFSKRAATSGAQAYRLTGTIVGLDNRFLPNLNVLELALYDGDYFYQTVSINAPTGDVQVGRDGRFTAQTQQIPYGKSYNLVALLGGQGGESSVKVPITFIPTVSSGTAGGRRAAMAAAATTSGGQPIDVGNVKFENAKAVVLSGRITHSSDGRPYSGVVTVYNWDETQRGVYSIGEVIGRSAGSFNVRSGQFDVVLALSTRETDGYAFKASSVDDGEWPWLGSPTKCNFAIGRVQLNQNLATDGYNNLALKVDSDEDCREGGGGGGGGESEYDKATIQKFYTQLNNYYIKNIRLSEANSLQLSDVFLEDVRNNVLADPDFYKTLNGNWIDEKITELLDKLSVKMDKCEASWGDDDNYVSISIGNDELVSNKFFEYGSNYPPLTATGTISIDTGYGMNDITATISLAIGESDNCPDGTYGKYKLGLTLE